jgi:uncharacterized membrane protein
MKTGLCSLVLLVSVHAQADVIKCFFTEPFFTIEYSTTSLRLKISGLEIPTAEETQVSFQIKAAGLFELHSQEHEVLMTLTLSGKGSDGMSDKVFPYEATLNAKRLIPGTHRGGCQSNFLKVSKP